MKTCLAVTGETWLNKFAEGAAMGHCDNSINFNAVGWFGIQIPIKLVLAVNSIGISFYH